MHRHKDSVKEYGTFLSKGKPVIGYGLSGRVPRGGVGTVAPRQDRIRVRQPEPAG